MAQILEFPLKLTRADPTITISFNQQSRGYRVLLLWGRSSSHKTPADFDRYADALTYAESICLSHGWEILDMAGGGDEAA